MKNDSKTGCKQIGYPVDMEITKATSFIADGDCMDSTDAPIRIKNGQRLKVHKYDGTSSLFANIHNLKGKVCVILYVVDGMKYGAVKEVFGIDELANTLRLKFYKPKETIVSLKIEYIDQIYVVDGIK